MARELGATSRLIFLVHPTITPKQMAGYADSLRSVVKHACCWRQPGSLPEWTAACTRNALLLADALADCPAERLPVARELGESSLMVLVHPTITPEQMAVYADAVRSVVNRACR